jgi:outer membrane lipoprotein-sorting protein
MTRLLLVFSFLIGAGFGSAETLDAVLARLDEGAAKFHSMTADVILTTHTAILNDDTTENGTLRMQRSKKGTQAIIEITGAQDQRTMGFFNQAIELYLPKTKLLQIYRLGKKNNFVDQYLLLGFGSSGRDLKKGYDIQLAGSEAVNGKAATKLKLVPKEKKVQENLSEVEIWIPQDSDFPVQQKFYNPNGNYRLAVYSNFQLNPPLGELKLTVPSDVKVENH